MIFLRSLAFQVAFYGNMIVWMALLAPTLLMPRRVLLGMVLTWSRLNLLILRATAGIRVELRGFEKLPAGGSLVALKHQSTFETLCLLHLFHDPTFILKRELAWIPIFGWYAAKLRMIPVDRARGREALKAMTRRALVEMQSGRSILIFPEGTRRPPGAEPAYKFGAIHLYRETGMPIVPVALNSGLFWPREGFLRNSGTIVVEMLDPIPPGLEADAAMARLRDVIETASDRLVAETAAKPDRPPLSAAALAAVARASAPSPAPGPESSAEISQ